MLKDCVHIRERLSAYLDGETTTAETELVARHLADCPECRRELAALERLSAALADLTVPGPPLALPRLGRRRTAWWQALTLAASLVLGLVTGSGLTGLLYPLTANGGHLELAALEEAVVLDPHGPWEGLEWLAPEEEGSA
ncbi:MAG: zf-HC2 domain-containing protein [Syntrophobacterales bacterium]|nr:zf-HC2 domain-containing protein [Syntrophobacterales bacterium]